MKIFEIKVRRINPVPSGLIIAANSMEEALEIANKEVKHTKIIGIEKINIEEAKVIFHGQGG